LAKATPDIAYVNRRVLTWAIERSRLSREDIASKLRVEANELKRWETGETQPPFEKAHAAARLLQFPFGYYFLSSVPSDDLPLPDRRRLGKTYRPSPEFLQLLNDVLVRQDWFRDYIRGRRAHPKFVGSHKITARVSDVAADIRHALSITPELRSSISSWTEYLSTLVRNAEDAGILVMRSSVVGHSTSRPITTNEVQGFAIADPIAPLVFVNSGDFKTAQIFTFAHELAHIWIGQSAINKTDETEVNTDRIEAFCNNVAAAVLVPQNEFQSAWDSLHPDKRLETLARRFWVSTLVVLRRAHELKRISTEEFLELRATERAKARPPRKSTGGDFYRTLFVRLGTTFTYSVVSELQRQKLLIRDAAGLLSVSPKTLLKVMEVAK
jgi:Zn-dependent peptidase ImmA (M78 family)